MATLLLSTLEKVTLTAGFVDAAGQAASIDGPATWESSDPSIITVENVSADGMSCDAVTVGPVGTARVTLSGDADLGGGTRLVTAVQDIEVRAAEAVSASIVAGTPVLK